MRPPCNCRRGLARRLPPPAPKLAENTVSVLVAAREIQPGEVLTEADLSTVRLPLRFVADGAVVTPRDLVGQTVIERLVPGEPVRTERLAEPERGTGVSCSPVRAKNTPRLPIAHPVQHRAYQRHSRTARLTIRR